MLKKHLIAIVVTAVLSIGLVALLYKVNYSGHRRSLIIGAEQTLNKRQLIIPDTILSLNKSAESRNQEQKPVTDNTTSAVQPEQNLLYEDIMIAIQTFTPLLSVLIPIYLNRKSKRQKTV